MKRLLFVLALFVAGCPAHSSYMVEATLTSAQLEPSAETAIVTFIRPSRYATLMSPAILDENASFVGAGSRSSPGACGDSTASPRHRSASSIAFCPDARRVIS